MWRASLRCVSGADELPAPLAAALPTCDATYFGKMENMLGKINGAFRSMGMGVKKPDRALRLTELLSDSLHIHFLSKYVVTKGQTDILIMWIEVRRCRGKSWRGAPRRARRGARASRARSLLARTARGLRCAREACCAPDGCAGSRRGAARSRAQCEQYKAANARLLRRHKAVRLIKAYVDGRNSALDEMGEAEIKAEILANYDKEDPSPSLFDPLQSAIEKAIEKDVLPGFYESAQYRELFAANGDFSAVLSADDFDILKFLGAGGFGMVLLVRRKATRRLYAMKVMDKRILISRKQVFSVFREKAALAHVTHPFIVSLKYALETEHLLLLICDFEKGGNMYSNIITHGAYPLERTRIYAAEMVLAIAQVHEMGILYRDMKPDNVLLDADGHCKLADMGAARGELAGGEIEIDGLSEVNRHKTLRPSELQATIALEELEKTLQESDTAADAGIEKPVPRSNRMTITGTHGYRAPEVYQRSYGKSADWWNLGLLLIEMLTGKVRARIPDRSEAARRAGARVHARLMRGTTACAATRPTARRARAQNPFRGNNRKESEDLAKNEAVKTPSWFTKETDDIVRAFLVRDTTKRLGCTKEGVDAILKHPFFKSIDWDEMMDLDEHRDKYPKWPQAEVRARALRLAVGASRALAVSTRRAARPLPARRRGATCRCRCSSRSNRRRRRTSSTTIARWWTICARARRRARTGDCRQRIRRLSAALRSRLSRPCGKSSSSREAQTAGRRPAGTRAL